MKAIIYIPSFENTQTLFPVLQNIRVYFPNALIRISCSIKNKERLEWLHSHAQMFQFAILEVTSNTLENEMIGLRETILECRELQMHLWILNGKVLVTKEVGEGLERAIKRRKRLGIIGVPSCDDEGRYCTPFRFFKPFANGPVTIQERRIPFTCALLNLDFLEKINPENVVKSQFPPSFYFSKLSKRLGYSNGLLNRMRVRQLSSPHLKKSGFKSTLIQLFLRKNSTPMEL